ncbi:MAG: SusC/RagA family TonB-linked outer membrane protein [Niabella sp.]
MIRGTVSAAENKEPLANISILVEGSSRGTVSNEKGIFFISASSGETLVFTGVGYATLKVVLKGQSELTVNLTRNKGEMENVIVTALGIRKNERTIGYAVTKIDSSQLTDAISTNWTDALSGKVAGLNLVRSGAGPASSNKIILRGENNLMNSTDNEALIVVDGVIVNDGSGRRSANASDNVYATGSDNLPADYGSSINDINPQDIESVSVLKGPAAAALYGQRAAGGAIMITTKSSYSKKKGHFNVKFTTNGSLTSQNRYLDRQYEYGQGLAGANYYSYGATTDGASTSGTSSAYGPRFNGQLFYQYDPATQARGTDRTEWKAYDNIDDFWDVGRDLTSTLSVDGKIATTAVRASLTSDNNSWIVPNTGFERKSISLSTSTDVTKKLKIITKTTYGFRNSDNLPAAGYGNQSLMYWYMFWQPSADYNWLRDYWDKDNKYTVIAYPFSSYPENPFAIVNEFLNKTRRNSVTGNVQASYQFTKELSLQVRGSLDWMNDKREQDRPYDAGSKLPYGSVRKQNIYSQAWNYDFLAKYNKKLTSDINFGASFGGSQYKNHYYKSDLRADGLVYPGIYDLSNNLYDIISIPDTSRMQINSFYGIINASYKNYLYLELTDRQDWSSTLATSERTDNSGFNYPSLNASFILTDFTKLPAVFDYVKLRASVASVGSGTNTAYMTTYTYPLASNNIYPDSAVTNPSIKSNPNLKPQNTISFELGTEVEMFKKRLNFDIALYMGATRNQILPRTLDRSSGYDAEYINAGVVRNSGIELSLNTKPIVSKNGFNWTVSGTFSYNRNKIVSMPDSSIVLRSGQIASGQIIASEGGSMGDLYGLGYERSPDGQIVYDATTGFPVITSDVIYLGNTTPKIKAGIGNTFRYKQFSLNVLFDAQYGAVAYSLTNYKMVEQGKLKSTLPGRYNGIIGKGVVQNEDGTYRKNDVVATDIDSYYQYSMGSYNAEGSTFSTDFIKFREASLNYAFKPRFLKRVGLGTAMIGIYGRDLFIWSPWPGFDPEFGTLSGTDIVRGFETGQFPSTRTIGFNLSIGF